MPGIYHDPKQEAQRVQDLQKRLSTGDDPNWLADALGRDFQRNIGALISGLTAPATALSGGYDQREIDPNTGAVSPVDPRMITDASNMAGFASLGSAGMVPADALGMGVKAFHGSPHSFDKFDVSKIGSGEGAQSYGHGLYFAENESVAKNYRDALTASNVIPQHVKTALSTLDDLGFDSPSQAMRAIRTHPDWMDRWDANPNDPNRPMSPKAAAAVKVIQDHISTPNKGAMYAVDINAQPEHFLDWDKPLGDQPATAIDALKQLATKKAPPFSDSMHKFAYENLRAKLADPKTTGQELYNAVGRIAGKGVNRDDVGATDLLRQAGVKGIRYLDAGSRAAGDGTRNYVVFDDKHVNIDKKYAKSGGTLNSEPDTALANIAQLKA